MFENKQQSAEITNVTNTYIITNSGSEEYIKSTDEISSLGIITDVVAYIKNLLVEGVRVIKEIITLRIVAVEAQFEQIFAKYAHIDVIENEEITTKKLCIN
jgi:formylmethanofuran dehydrogenase subunit E-like metal-binding protein